MDTLIKGIKIPDETYSFIDCEGNKKEVIRDLSKINIFVGANNTGKSRLIRALLSTKEFNYIPAKISIEEINEFIKELKNQIDEYIPKGGSGMIDILKDIGEIEDIEFVNDSFKLHEQIDNLEKRIEGIRRQTNVSVGNLTYPQIGNKLMNILETCTSTIGEGFKEKIIPPKFTKIYIPILRGIRFLDISGTDVYGSRTLRDYFNNRMQGFEIISGIATYKDVKSHLLGNLEKRRTVKEYEDYFLVEPKEFSRQLMLLKSMATPYIQTYEQSKEKFEKIQEHSSRPAIIKLWSLFPDEFEYVVKEIENIRKKLRQLNKVSREQQELPSSLMTLQGENNLVFMVALPSINEEKE